MKHTYGDALIYIHINCNTGSIFTNNAFTFNTNLTGTKYTYFYFF